VELPPRSHVKSSLLLDAIEIINNGEDARSNNSIGFIGRNGESIRWFRNKRGLRTWCISVAPDRHIASTMSYDCTYPIDRIINGAYRQHTIVFLGENCQICRSFIESRSKRSTTFAVGAVVNARRLPVRGYSLGRPAFGYGG